MHCDTNATHSKKATREISSTAYFGLPKGYLSVSKKNEPTADEMTKIIKHNESLGFVWNETKQRWERKL